MTAEPTVEDPWFLYVLRCGDGSLYAGIARDWAARLEQHREGRGARYTRGRGPLQVVFLAQLGSRGEALKTEWAFKQWSRSAKEALVADARGVS